MDFGTSVREVVGIFAQQHRAFDSLGLRQLRSFSFGELEQGPTHAASLRVTIAPPPVLDELLSGRHALVIDRDGTDLRQRDKDSATFLAKLGMPLVASTFEVSNQDVPEGGQCGNTGEPGEASARYRTTKGLRLPT